MYDVAGPWRTARRQGEGEGEAAPPPGAAEVLGRVRRLLGNYLPGMSCDPRRWPLALASGVPDALEAERLFALGWLRWAAGDPAAAEELLAAADERCRLAPEVEEPGALPPLGPGVLAARSAYWRARVGVLRGRADAVAGYEAALRRLGGSPQATAWYVDLLWRDGRIDRAEQVWKAVRANKRVAGCDEGPLLEARGCLRRGELGLAEKLLREAAPTNGVAWVERLLLLCWAQAGLRQPDRAAESLRQAGEGPYPPTALHTWAGLLHARGRGEGVTAPALPGWEEWLQGQAARQEGRHAEAGAHYRAAMSRAAVAPFARFGLVCLGQESPTVVLVGAPGLFFALRCRARQAVGRFCAREISAGELLEVLQQAAQAGYAGAEHYRRLARVLQLRPPSAGDLHELLAAEPTDAGRRNAARVALEQLRRLPPAEALPVVRGLAGAAWLDGPLGEELARQGVRLALLLGDPGVLNAGGWGHATGGATPAMGPATPATGFGPVATPSTGSEDSTRGFTTWPPPPGVPERPALEPLAGDRVVKPRVESSEPGGGGAAAPVDALARALLGDEDAPGEEPPAVVWAAARALARGAVDAGWHERLRAVRAPRYRGLAQALLLQEAAGRADLPAVGAALEDLDAWRAFRGAPPAFVVRVLEALAAAQPGHPVWQRCLPGWLALWDAGATGALSSAAGAGPPAGVDPAAWFLHQAARAWQADDPAAALAFVQQAQASTSGPLPPAGVVEAALPLLRRLADAAALAGCLGGAARAEALADLVDLLQELPTGQAVLGKAREGDGPGVRAALAELGGQPGLPGRLHHHLALLAWRGAQGQDEGDLWRQAWQSWVSFLSGPDGPAEAEQGVLLEHLLGVHRGRINDLLARDEVPAARAHAALVRSLPGLWPALAAPVARWGEDLATGGLLAAREAMRHGAFPDGWRANYDAGLPLLRRLLSLNPEDGRLLTALVEVCAEWFLDLYNTSDGRLADEVRRATPLARQLARLAGARTVGAAARAAVAEFWKFRGFVEPDPAARAALYREALRFDPGNGNVRELLAQMGESTEAGEGDEREPV
jgi:tetratricopeptide (TPR) repeat protein